MFRVIIDLCFILSIILENCGIIDDFHKITLKFKKPVSKYQHKKKYIYITISINTWLNTTSISLANPHYHPLKTPPHSLPTLKKSTTHLGSHHLAAAPLQLDKDAAAAPLDAPWRRRGGGGGSGGAHLRGWGAPRTRPCGAAGGVQFGRAAPRGRGDLDGGSPWPGCRYRCSCARRGVRGWRGKRSSICCQREFPSCRFLIEIFWAWWGWWLLRSYGWIMLGDI